MKVAIVIGHTRTGKGAYSKHLLKHEYDFFKSHEGVLSSLGDVFYHSPFIYGYNNRQKAMARKTKDYDLVFELHFNAANGKAHGCEALHYFSNKQTKHLSEVFCEVYTDITGSKNRGAKALYNKEQRGFGFVKHQKPNAILLEPFFGDNAIDCARFTIYKLFEAIQKTIICAELQY